MSADAVTTQHPLTDGANAPQPLRPSQQVGLGSPDLLSPKTSSAAHLSRYVSHRRKYHYWNSPLRNAGRRNRASFTFWRAISCEQWGYCRGRPCPGAKMGKVTMARGMPPLTHLQARAQRDHLDRETDSDEAGQFLQGVVQRLHEGPSGIRSVRTSPDGECNVSSSRLRTECNRYGKSTARQLVSEIRLSGITIWKRLSFAMTIASS